MLNIPKPTSDHLKQYKKFIKGLIIEDDETYNKSRDIYLSSSSLKDFIKYPRLYEAKHITKEIEYKSGEAFYIGTLAHMVILEGVKKTMESYAFTAPLNKEGIEFSYGSKAFEEEEIKQAKEGLKLARKEDYQKTLEMRRAVIKHEIASELLRGGKAEGVLRANLNGHPAQIKMDKLTPYGIIDLKTVFKIDGFYSKSNYCDVKKFGYLHSAAYYRSIFHANFPDAPKPNFYFIAVEKTPPYPVGVWLVDPFVLDHYESLNTAALEELKLCLKNGVWGTPYDGLRVIEQ